MRGNEVVYWVCPRFPVNMSITAVRDAFMRLDLEKAIIDKGEKRGGLK